MVWNFVNGKNQMTAMLRGKNYHILADEPTVTVLDGEAKFIADHEIEVTTAAGEKEQYRGERIFINTGALPVMLPIPGLAESNAILDSTAAMDQKEMPEKLVINEIKTKDCINFGSCFDGRNFCYWSNLTSTNSLCGYE